MNIFDFITKEELDDLPDDPRLAFSEFVRLSEHRLLERTAKFNDDSESSWRLVEEARHSFMNIVVAAAKRYQIEPFTTLDVPRIADFGYDTHRQFKADLDHYMTQLLIENSARGKRDTVFIENKPKDSIRGYLYGLRTCIEKSNLNDSKKEKLFKKLNEFETELDRKRVNILAVTKLTLEILALPGGVWESSEMVHKLTTNVLQTVGEAKVAEEESRALPSAAPSVALSPPRQEEANPKQLSPPTSSGWALPPNFDDEIPF